MWGVSYWVFPVISGLCWLGMLMGLLIHWTSTGKPHYPSMDATQSIAYISDVGAQSLKPLFIAGSCVTTIFLDASFLSERWLRHRGQYREHRILRISFWIKLTFILLEVVLAIAFGTCNFKDKYNAAAVLEWTIAFIFTFYVFSFFIDLLPAVKTKHDGRRFGDGQGETQMQMEQNDEFSREEGRGGRMTGESQRTVGGNDVRVVNGAKYENGPVPVASNF
ncbi:Frag1/DRAM/Sfk1 family-domain-containing protein [Rhexocercosporidium sp. MPI-PUGE-AT-0058]|nr:Frag1/DRAM/Sfk1 family-domain-containing protein [Rhexocercosporidium sp. MPI-PUGE-AT-0058]